MKTAVNSLPARNAKSGIYGTSKKSRKLRDAQVQYHLRKMRALCPWLERSDIYVARRFAELELLASRAYAALRSREILSDQGQSRRLLDDYRRLVALQVIAARELGLSPAARQALKQSGQAPYDLVAAFAADDARERAQRKAIEARPTDENETSDAAAEKSGDE